MLIHYLFSFMKRNGENENDTLEYYLLKGIDSEQVHDIVEDR